MRFEHYSDRLTKADRLRRQRDNERKLKAIEARERLNEAAPALLEASQKAIDTHRTESFITCEETCWCWDLEATIALAEKEG